MAGANAKDQICLNPDCPDYRKRNTGAIIKKGFNAKGNQMFKCKTCGVRFPETKGTVFYNRHLNQRRADHHDLQIAGGEERNKGY